MTQSSSCWLACAKSCTPPTHLWPNFEIWDQNSRQGVLEINIVMSSSLFMFITYYSVMTDTNECDWHPVMVPLTGTTFQQTSPIFLFFSILSNCFRLQTVRRFPTGTYLSHTLHHFANMCLPHGEPCSIKPNFILDSSFPCCAWLCCHTHVHSPCLCFFFHCATAMWLHHAFNPHHACPRLYW